MNGKTPSDFNQTSSRIDIDDEEWSKGHVARLTIDMARSTAFMERLDPWVHQRLSQALRTLYEADALELDLSELHWQFTGDGWETWSGDPDHVLPLAAFAMCFIERFKDRLIAAGKLDQPRYRGIEVPGLRISLCVGSEIRPARTDDVMDWLSRAAIQAARAQDISDPQERPIVVNKAAEEELREYLVLDEIEDSLIDMMGKHHEAPKPLFSIRDVRDVVKRAIQEGETGRTTDFIAAVMEAKEPGSAAANRNAKLEQARNTARSNVASPEERGDALIDLIHDARSDEDAETAYRAAIGKVSVPRAVFELRRNKAPTAMRAFRWLEREWQAFGTPEDRLERQLEYRTIIRRVDSVKEATEIAGKITNPTDLGRFTFVEALTHALTNDDAALGLQNATLFGVGSESELFEQAQAATFRARNSGNYDSMYAIAVAAGVYAKGSLSPDAGKWVFTFTFFEAQALDCIGKAQDGLVILEKLDWESVNDEEFGTVGRLPAKHLEAQLLDSIGKSAAALEKINELLPIRERVEGPEHREVLTTRHEQARLLDKVGQSRQALEKINELLPVREQVEGPENPEVLTTRHEQARLMDKVGQSAAALEKINELLPVRERVLGAEHPRVLSSRLLQMRVMDQLGQSKQALEKINELLPVRERIEGTKHPNVLVTRHEQARLMDRIGQSREALIKINELLPVREQVEGIGHPEVLSTQFLQARLMGKLGQTKEALEKINELLPVREQVLGTEHPYVLTTRHEQACLLNNIGESVEALQRVNDLLPVRERINGPEHPHTFASYRARAEILRSLDRLEDAESNARLALIGSEQQEENTPEFTQRCRVTLAEIVADCGKDAESRQLNSIALSWYRERVLPEEYWRKRSEALAVKLGGGDSPPAEGA